MNSYIRKLFTRRVKGAPTPPARPARRAPRTLLRVDTLEDRTAPAILTVTTAANSGPGSLRQAVLTANSTSTPDTIVFDPVLFSTPQTIQLSILGEMVITNPLTIQGPGANLLTVSADPNNLAVNNRVFSVTGVGTIDVTISGMTLTGGNLSGANDGGAILDGDENLTLDSVVITGNKTARYGGGVSVAGSSTSLTITNSVISNNTASGTGLGGGGGVHLGGFGDLLTVQNSTISGNTANRGGGLYFFDGGSLQLSDSTISGNVALSSSTAYSGGGVSFFGPAFQFQVLNSTVDGNNATGAGGGIALADFSGTADIVDSTITGNTCTAGRGGGISKNTSSGTLSLTNTVVAQNNNVTGPDVAVGGGQVTANNSLLGSADSLILTGSGNQFGTNASPLDPKLGPLQNNGGLIQTGVPALTRVPLAGSPLVDAGSNTQVPFGVTNDQRGTGFARIFGSTVDIGATERQPAPVNALSITTTTTSPTNATPINFTVTFSGDVQTLPASAFRIIPGGTVNAVIGTPTGSGPTWTVPVSGITGDGTLTLQLFNGVVVAPAVANAPVGGPTLTIDTTPPTVIINQGASQSDPTANSPITFGVQFSEPVTGFTASGVSFAGSTATGILTAAVTGSGANYVVTVTGMGPGKVVASIPAGSALDAAGNGNLASTSTDNTVTFNGPLGPQIVLPGPAVTYREGDPPVPIDPGATVSDSNASTFDTGVLTVSFSVNGTAPDRIEIVNQGTNPGQIGVSGSTVSYGGTDIGTFTGGAGASPLVVTFNMNADANAVTALLENLVYKNVSIDPSGLPRTVRFSMTDGASGVSNAAVKTINVLPVNNAPTLNPIPDPPAILENAGTQTVSLGGISTGGEVQTLTVTAVSSNPALIPNPTVSYTSPNATGTLTYAPVPNTFGTATITVTVKDDGGTANGGVDTVVQTFTVTVTFVNQQPTLDVIPDTPILEDAGPQTVNLTRVSGGPNETQNVTITAVSSNPALIPNPTVNYTSPNTSGTLTYTPVANAFGTATITVTVKDDGGTANGGVDTLVRTFTVTVTPVNDPPTLAVIPDATIVEDSPPQTVNLTGITAGPNESQTITITAVSSNPALIPNPTVSYTSPGAAGTLTYAPVQFVSGTATITVTVKDDGGTANGGVDTLVRTFTVTVTPVAHAPVGQKATTFEDQQTGGGLFISPNPVDGQTVQFFKITTITGGTLFLADGVTPVADGSFITVLQGRNGLKFTPLPDANSSTGQVFGFAAQGSIDANGTGLGPGTVVPITVVPVNDAPRFVAGPSVTSDGTSGRQVFPGWATGISAGPPDEAGQVLTFHVAASNPALFLVQPAVDPATGTLTFTPAPGANGTTAVQVFLKDNGGTDNGGVDTSAAQTFSITLTVRLTDQNEVRQLAVGPGPGTRDTVTVYNADGTIAYTLGGSSLSGAMVGGARVAVGDVTGDGVPDVVTATGPGVPALIIITDGVTHQPIRGIIPFEGTFTGGLFVAVGDIDKDGAADIAVSPDEGGGGRVEVYSGRGTVRLANFFGIDDPTFRGGARVAFGDFNHDGTADLAVAAGFQGGPRVALFDGKSLLTGFPTKLVNDFFVFEPSVRDGVFVTAGDVNGDGWADLIVGGGPSGSPRVSVIDGKSLIQQGSANLILIANFFAGDEALRTGVTVTAKDIDGDNKADVVVGLETSTGGTVKSFTAKSLLAGGQPQEKWEFDAFVDPFSGVFVG
jgi:hypothetical protein